jgi:phosphopantetheinyl transferase
MVVARDFLRDIPLEWIARLYLHSDEMPEFRELAPYLSRQREWLMGRLAAKDVVRTWVFRHHPTDGELVHPSTIIIRNDELGRPLVAWIAGCEARPQISISHCPRAAMAAAGEAPLGVDIAVASPVPLELWDEFTTPKEREMLAELLRAQPIESWATRVWCAKEAVGKALGIGLAGRPRDFEVTAVGAQGQVQVCHRPTGEVFDVSTDRDETMILAATVRSPQARFALRTPDVVLGPSP